MLDDNFKQGYGIPLKTFLFSNVIICILSVNETQIPEQNCSLERH